MVLPNRPKQLGQPRKWGNVGKHWRMVEWLTFFFWNISKLVVYQLLERLQRGFWLWS